MAVQFSTTVRDAIANAYETAIGASPKLQLRTGAQPANCAAADTGTLIGELTLPADWVTASSGGAIALNGSWGALTAVAAGTIGHYRLKNNAATVTHEQGTVTATGGGGDMTISNVVAAIGDSFTINTWAATASGA